MIGGGCGKCNMQNWLVTSLVVAIVYWGLDMFFTHFCMMKLYQANAQFFRTPEEMTATMKWGYAGYLVFGALFSCIFSKGYEAGKPKALQGLRFGLLIGLLYWGAGMLGMYPYFPWPNRLFIDWTVIGVVEFAVLGLVLGLLFKPKQA